MTLYQVLDKIKRLAYLNVPNVQANNVGIGSIYDWENAQGGERKFPNVCITQQQHKADFTNDTITYNFIIYYVDRLTDDGQNELEVQSVAVSQLKKIAGLLYDEGLLIDESVYFDTFTQSFQSLCAGAYMTVNLKVDDINGCI